MSDADIPSSQASSSRGDGDTSLEVSLLTQCTPHGWGRETPVEHPGGRWGRRHHLRPRQWTGCQDSSSARHLCSELQLVHCRGFLRQTARGAHGYAYGNAYVCAWAGLRCASLRSGRRGGGTFSHTNPPVVGAGRDLPLRRIQLRIMAGFSRALCASSISFVFIPYYWAH